MKAMLAALVAALLVSTPVLADHRQSEVERLVRWTGCKATVVTSDLHMIEDSFFAADEDGAAVAIGTGAKRPPLVDLFVILHEAAHCLQYQETGFYGFVVYCETKACELDADRRAIEMACRLGVDGPRMVHDVWVWFHERFGYEGDDSHGSLAERIKVGEGACQAPREPQA